MVKYNFEENIIKLSESDDINDLPNEWEFIARFTHVEKVKICICNCKIKNYSLFINVKIKMLFIVVIVVK